MTAEVIVMNKLAISVAADSAVTITVARGQKIYQSANKLFALGKHIPVGIMVYGSAEFMGVPWESIVKTYRFHLGTKTYPSVEDYSRDFTDYLERNRNLFPSQAQERYVKTDSHSYLAHMGGEISKHIKDSLKTRTAISEAEVAALIETWLGGRLAELRALALADRLPKSFPRKLLKQYEKQFSEAISVVYQDLPLTNSSSARIPAILAEVFSRELLGNPSGLVIMGFGSQDVFPKAIEYLVRGIAADRLWSLRRLYQIIGPDNSSAIIPFAQSEMVSTFMEGVDPDLANFLMGMFATLLTGYIDQVAEALPGSEQSMKEEFKKRIATVCKEQLEQLEQGFDKYRKEKHVHPIMSMISALPKDELARVAEALVNLTSFKRRVSAQEETVAEPIDVAVISRGDGFVWVKRKHYFPSNLNPGWAERLTGDINA
jgi:hypothetical protein